MGAGAVEVNINSSNARRCAKFDGNDKITTTVTTTLTNRSISFWIMPRNLTSGDRLYDKREAGAETEFATMDTAPDNIQMQLKFDTNAYKWTSASGVPEINVWKHIIITTNDIDEAKIYVNGIEGVFTRTGSPAGNRITNTDSYLIGNRGSADRPYDGFMYDFKIFNRILSAAECLQLAQNVNITKGLLVHYPLKIDYSDSVGGADATNSGTSIAIFDRTIAAAIQADRTTANDIYLLAESGAGKQAISTIIEEAP